MEKTKSVDELTDETIKAGGYLANLYFDLHSKSAEEVKALMVGFIGKLTKERGVVYAVGEIDQPQEKDGIWSTWAEVKLLAEDFSTLVRLAAQYSPIGVEILRPDAVRLSNGEAQGILLDISQTSQNFTRLIMERVLSKEEAEQFRKKMQSRAELGRKILERKGK
ncbi:MAG: hypothetical protein N3E51_01915 [Candidatus Micrarchaeota archaeon]|nr:hypothetical protein [Candidatus Micrarchaeota archaeon]